MSATIPSHMLMSDLLKATGYDCPARLQGKTFDEATPQSGTIVQTNKEVSITANGVLEVEPSEGYDAMAKATVNVNVPSDMKPEQAKSVTITENGTTTVMPDVGKVLTEVEVTTNVHPQIVLQDKTVTENGTYTADEGYAGLGEVTVAVPVPEVEERKSVSITENGVTEITPSAGKDAIAGVLVDVDVKAKARAWESASAIVWTDFDKSPADLLSLADMQKLAFAAAGSEVTGISKEPFVSSSKLLVIGNQSVPSWSADGSTWTAGTGVSGILTQAPTTFKGIYTAGSAWSVDGKAWTGCTRTDSQYGFSVYDYLTTDDLVIVAAGTGGILWSEDGKVFTAATNGSGNIRRVIKYENVLYAFNGSPYNILTSMDEGKTWAELQSMPGYSPFVGIVNGKLICSVYSAGLFELQNGQFVSLDVLTSNSRIYDVTYDSTHNKYFAATGSGLWSSAALNGTWSQIPGFTIDLPCVYVDQETGLLLAQGHENGERKFYWSDDGGTTFTQCTSEDTTFSSYPFTYCIKLDGKYYAMFQSELLYSSDGKAWSAITGSIGNIPNSISMLSIPSISAYTRDSDTAFTLNGTTQYTRAAAKDVELW